MQDVMLRGTDNLISYSQIVWLSSIFYNACLGFIKTSVLALYARLGDRELRRLAFVIIGVVACQAGANVIVCIFQCTPVQAACESSPMTPRRLSLPGRSRGHSLTSIDMQTI